MAAAAVVFRCTMSNEAGDTIFRPYFLIAAPPPDAPAAAAAGAFALSFVTSAAF
jgi:hypothetical protein